MVPCGLDEQLSLELAGDGDGHVTVTVRESRPMIAVDGSIRYILRLAFDASAPSTAPGEGQRQS